MRPLNVILAAILALFTLAVAAPRTARADIVINVDQGATQPLPIAVGVFSGGGMAA